MTAVLLACGSSTPAPVAPTVAAVAVNPGPPPITGRERLGWVQTTTTDELAGLGFVMYVDDVRSILADATCTSSATGVGFDCTAQLPTMTNGSHTLELASFLKKDTSIESNRSAPLKVTIAALTAGDDAGMQLRDRRLREERGPAPRQKGREPGKERR